MGGKCIALTAVYQGHPAGSVYVYMEPHDGPFKGKLRRACEVDE